MSRLRTWQRRALTRYLLSKNEDFMVVATPGAGKTTFALTAAAELMARGDIEQIIVVTPTEHLKTQWAQSAVKHSIRLDPAFSGSVGRISSDYHGFATTYAGVATAPGAIRTRALAKPTMVILDEIHHAGDAKSWGEAIRTAFTPAERRLSLTGTPFRSDDSPIPFATYEPVGDGTSRSVPDFSYGYADALRDSVVRPVIFMAYSGHARWRTRAGDEIAMRLGEIANAEHTQRAWNTALDPHGDWIPAVLKAAHTRLRQLRDGVPDAGGLVIASDQASARDYAELLEHLTGSKPTIVLSDDRRSSDRIGEFSRSTDEWIVAVRMVSEGVDIPRLGVLVYATNVGTPMFFAQAVGRVIRARQQEETATVFLPSIGRLRALASQLEAERDHVIGAPKDPEEWDESREERPTAERDPDDVAFEALEASADFDDVIFDGNTWGTAGAGTSEDDFLGIPGLLAPEQVTLLLRQRQEEQVKRTATRTPRAEPMISDPGSGTHHEVIKKLRRELNSLVSLRYQRSGVKHATTHAELRRVCGGPPTPLANAEQLQTRIEYLRRNRD